MNPKLTIYYDEYCPLCVAEMSKLKVHDTQKQIQFSGVQSLTTEELAIFENQESLMGKLHGKLPDGSIITGLDVTHEAWRLAGKGWLVAPLRWPLLKPLADILYLFFARYRYQISFLLTGKKRCESCSIKSSDNAR